MDSAPPPPVLPDVKEPGLIRVKLSDFAGSDVSVKGVSSLSMIKPRCHETEPT